ncbi:GUN4 domain-containing protein [Thermosynechococcus sp. HN-54]|uniref:GUN4 domain-containing protein n=1 Tax=Thermosynechococcus sp. HN-54 TaxID=2933959 RepID=UPI00202CE8D4|nr:GUN4 domain-containing protein [Thermosynechococcus sp. HN-54]URR34668.1 GUN4 domain-containing protein [Thermosynechococcus sp. HN-54]
MATPARSSSSIPQPRLRRRQFIRFLGWGSFSSVAVSCASAPPATNQSLAPTPPALADYSNLEKLLQQQQWLAANAETAFIVSEVERQVRTLQSGPALNEPLSPTFFSIKLARVPCDVLKEIDQRWLKYSQGRFGLSVQAKIWQTVGRPTTGAELAKWNAFGDRLGWRSSGRWLTYNRLKPSPTTHQGTLPYFGEWFGQLILNLNVQGIEPYLVSLYSYVERCGL